MGVPILNKTYSFWQDKFYCTYIYYNSDNDKETLNKLYQKLVEKYDEPSKGRFDESLNARYYVWEGEQTHIMLYYFLNKKESYIFFVSKEIYDEQDISP